MSVCVFPLLTMERKILHRTFQYNYIMERKILHRTFQYNYIAIQSRFYILPVNAN